METTSRYFFLVLLIMLLQFSDAFCQEDYVIVEPHDTICGSITQAFPLFSTKIKIRTESGKQTFDYSRTNEYLRNGVKFMKAKRIGAKGELLTYHCKVLVDGNIRLLEETQQEGAEYFVYYHGEFLQVNCKYFSNEIWEMLTTCPEFSAKYADYRKGIKSEKFMVFPAQRRLWVEMIHYSNQQCH